MEKSDFYRDARKDLPGPLAGIRVLEATASCAGPMCGCVLADLGADVIKVEDPVGEVGRRIPPFLPGANRPISFLQATVNRNKRSLTLDLRTPQGREIFLKLTRKADIVVQNFRPGTFDRWESAMPRAVALSPISFMFRSAASDSSARFTTESATIHLRRPCPDSCRSMGRSRGAQQGSNFSLR
jgi:formyl-CoA transferase